MKDNPLENLSGSDIRQEQDLARMRERNLARIQVLEGKQRSRESLSPEERQELVTLRRLV